MIKDSQLAILISRQVLMFILSLSLFFGGIVILLARIPGWSLFFGLIVIPIGTILTILTLDEIARKLFSPADFRPVKCNVCGKTTYAKEAKEDVICGHCREEEIEQLLKEKGRI